MSKNIIVTGDVTMDWNLARIDGGSSDGFAWNTAQFTNLSCREVVLPCWQI
ncbi:MAG: hypothetical protein WBB69_08945 [Anaerolineales bacterium]